MADQLNFCSHCGGKLVRVEYPREVGRPGAFSMRTGKPMFDVYLKCERIKNGNDTNHTSRWDSVRVSE